MLEPQLGGSYEGGHHEQIHMAMWKSPESPDWPGFLVGSLQCRCTLLPAVRLLEAFVSGSKHVKAGQNKLATQAPVGVDKNH